LPRGSSRPKSPLRSKHRWVNDASKRHLICPAAGRKGCRPIHFHTTLYACAGLGKWINLGLSRRMWMRLAALFSGGKDSTYAIYSAGRMGHGVEVLLTFIPKSVDSYLFHYPNIHLTPLQAESMGLRQLLVPVEGGEEETLERALGEVSGRVDGLLTGALASSYQRNRMEKAAEKHGLKLVSPLWGREPGQLLREIVSEGFRVMVVAVAAAGLGEEWLGRVIDEDAVRELDILKQRYGVHPAGEGGEMETLVLDCPIFRKRLHPKRVEKVWKGYYGYLIVHEAELVEK
jgi:diphthine-ammonia ligase